MYRHWTFALVCASLSLSVHAEDQIQSVIIKTQAAEAQPVETQPTAPAQLKKTKAVKNAMLDGFCPVNLIDNKKWIEGKESISTLYDGRTYRFSDQNSLLKFQTDVHRYAICLQGDDVVSYTEKKARVAGKLELTMFYDNRIFLFISKENKAKFVKNPTQYHNADLAWNGDCSVCLLDANIQKPGNSTYATHYKGIRYLFPNIATLNRFLGNPDRYVDPSKAALKSDPNIISKSSPDQKSEAISVKGKTACAVCKFGVSPLKSPDELGLALYTEDGKVYVIEQAHKKYPAIYLDREKDQRISLKGVQLKQKGNVVWIEPQEVKVLQ